MNRRWLLGVVAIVVALLLWWLAGGGSRGGKRGASAAKPTAGASSGGGSARAVRGKDPKAGAAGTIAGAITADGGGAIGGAWVCASVSWSQDDISIDDAREPHCTTSAPDGRYTIAPLWGGKWTVQAGAP